MIFILPPTLEALPSTLPFNSEQIEYVYLILHQAEYLQKNLQARTICWYIHVIDSNLFNRLSSDLDCDACLRRGPLAAQPPSFSSVKLSSQSSSRPVKYHCVQADLGA